MKSTFSVIFYLKRQATVPKPMPTADNTPKIRHFDFYTDEFHHYPVDIPQNCLDVIDKNIALNADNVFARIGDVQKTAILLFAEYIDAATTIAAQVWRWRRWCYLRLGT